MEGRNSRIAIRVDLDYMYDVFLARDPSAPLYVNDVIQVSEIF